MHWPTFSDVLCVWLPNGRSEQADRDRPMAAAVPTASMERSARNMVLLDIVRMG